jgi:dimethylhistidine N-methyltransferase
MITKFALDIQRGLLAKNKFIPSKYFYDKTGAELFNKITKHPDYYLTNCELEILHANKNYLANLCSKESFNIIELGPGEGIKAQILIQEFLLSRVDFIYFAVDICGDYLQQIAQKFKQKNPSLAIKIIQADYASALHKLDSCYSRKNFVLFLGSSIGNFDNDQTIKFLQQTQHDLKAGDYLFIGFDLQKDPRILLQAYDDRDNITRDFNLNLLLRMNRDLATDFNIKNFIHKAEYNKNIHAMESFLVSIVKQQVYTPYLDLVFNFEENEHIHVEYSYKYNLELISKIAHESGFKIVKNFFDKKNYYVNSLWCVEK